MKILQVITSLKIGGAEKLIVDMSLILKSKGYNVDVFVFDGTRTPFWQQLEEKSVKVISYNEGASPYEPSNVFKLARLIPQYDIVHTHNTSCQYYAAIAKLWSKTKKTKFVTTEHSANNRRRSMFVFKYLDKWMYHRYDSIIAISDKTEINLHLFLGKNFHIETIYNGINLNQFINAKVLFGDSLLNRKPNDFVITMVAGFRHEKDQDTLIKSLKHLPAKCKLWLIGDGVRRQLCEELVRSLGLSDRVVFAGIRADIPNILKASDVIVMSSHWEGLSLSSIEGMSVGKPFIASDVDGLHEIVEGNGILFPHLDDKRLAEAILKLMNEPNYAQNIAKRCFSKANQYDITKTVDAYMAVYERLIYR